MNKNINLMKKILIPGSDLLFRERVIHYDEKETGERITGDAGKFQYDRYHG